MEPNFHPGDKVIFTGWPADIPRRDEYTNDMPETGACYCGNFDNMIGKVFVIDRTYLVKKSYTHKEHYRYFFKGDLGDCKGCYFVEEWFQAANKIPVVVVEDLL